MRLKVEHKYCDDFIQAMKFWNHKCIVDAYFNQATTSTADEQKLKERLRRKRLQARMGSFNRESQNTPLVDST